MSVSVHVVDGVYGQPAAGCPVSLSMKSGGSLSEQWRDHTDEDGRISGLMRSRLACGAYALELDLDRYYSTRGFASSHSAITVHFHVPSETYYYKLAVLITPSVCAIFRED
jgi:5-hydroxyisourate hydrolase-like protein (transthyretin family)